MINLTFQKEISETKLDRKRVFFFFFKKYLANLSSIALLRAKSLASMRLDLNTRGICFFARSKMTSSETLVSKELSTEFISSLVRKFRAYFCLQERSNGNLSAIIKSTT